MEKPDYFQINSVHIGNFGSAFVEVLVGRKGLVAGKDGFVGLLPTSSFQDPLEARSEKNTNRVKLFTGVVIIRSLFQVSICTRPFCFWSVLARNFGNFAPERN